MALFISWTEEMLMMVLKLEDAEDKLEDTVDKLRGPQGEGEGDIEDMTTSRHPAMPHTTFYPTDTRGNSTLLPIFDQAITADLV